jgi:hypothetical protein
VWERQGNEVGPAWVLAVSKVQTPADLSSSWVLFQIPGPSWNKDQRESVHLAVEIQVERTVELIKLVPVEGPSLDAVPIQPCCLFKTLIASSLRHPTQPALERMRRCRARHVMPRCGAVVAAFRTALLASCTCKLKKDTMLTSAMAVWRHVPSQLGMECVWESCSMEWPSVCPAQVTTPGQPVAVQKMSRGKLHQRTHLKSW